MKTPAPAPTPPGGAAPANSMPAAWCAARVADARAWRDAYSDWKPEGWRHVHELLSQIDNPPAAPAPALVLPDGVVRMPDEQRVELKKRALRALNGPDPIALVSVKATSVLGTLAYVEALEARVQVLEWWASEGIKHEAELQEYLRGAERRVGELAAAMRWIPVGESVPEIHKTTGHSYAVQVYRGDHVCVYAAYYTQAGFHELDSPRKMDGVTHWRHYTTNAPTPAAPVGEAPAAPNFVVDELDVWDDYCERCGTPEWDKDEVEGCCSLCGEGIFKAMPKREADALGVKFDEWVEAENKRRDGLPNPGNPHFKPQVAAADFSKEGGQNG